MSAAVVRLRLIAPSLSLQTESSTCSPDCDDLGNHGISVSRQVRKESTTETLGLWKELHCIGVRDD